ncbi:MAG TPA: urea ABC transporter permease subunit UrtC, partial [Devosia sp.]
ANSIEVVIWTAVGGRGTIVGPIIGAVLVNMGKSFFTGALPEYWLFALGGLFIVVTLFLPRGIVGTISDLTSGKYRRKGKEASSAAEAGEDASTLPQKTAPEPAE